MSEAKPPIEGMPLKPGTVVDPSTATGLISDPDQLEPLTAEQAAAELRAAEDEARPKPETHKVRVIPPSPAAIPKDSTETTEDGPEEEMPVTPEKGDTKTLPVVSQCPRCGHHLDLPVDDMPTVEDRRNFVRALLTGDRFVKSYTLFGGLIRVWFRSRNVDEGESVVTRAQQQVMAMSNPALLQIEITKLNLTAALTRLETYDESGKLTDSQNYPFVTEETYPPEDDELDKLPPVARAHEILFSNMNAQMYSAIFRAFMRFTVVTDVLMMRADDSDFWKATPSQA